MMPSEVAARPRFSVRERLRAETGPAHERLDAAFAAYDLSDGADYARFLQAHARAVLPLEAMLRPITPWPAWRPRGDALADDLRTLGASLPPPLSAPVPGGEAEAWGMLYVLEGSRLGGVLLAGQVGPALPRVYLSDCHEPGEWRDFLAAMEAAVSSADGAVRGADAAFGLFARSAAEVRR